VRGGHNWRVSEESGIGGRRGFALGLVLFLIAIGPASLARSQPSGPAAPGAASRPGIPLPHSRGIEVPFSRLLGAPARRSPGGGAIAERRAPGRRSGSRSDEAIGGQGPAARPGSPRAGAPVVGTSFLGTQLADGPGVVPPDSMGGVGPSQVAVVVNGRLRFFDKAGNLQFDVDLDAFFDPVRNGSDVSDPHIRYDRLSRRWVIVAINVESPSNRVLIAASSGPTISPQSSFEFFAFGQPPADELLFADYPTLGVDRSALYIGVNNFDISGQFVSTSGFVIHKAALLNGTFTGFAFRNLGTAFVPGPFAPQGASSDDPTLGQGYFIGVDSLGPGPLYLRRVSNPDGTPTISGNLILDVPATTFPQSVPAQGTPSDLDGLDDRLLAAVIAKDPASGAPRLWTAHNIEVDAAGNASSSGGRDGSRWYEIDLSGTPALVQSGTVFDPAVASPASYWVPSIAANGPGQALLGSSFAGAGRFAGISIAQRFRGDPPGTLSAPLLVQPGLAAYDVPSIPPGDPQRWGDYSQVVVDPSNEMTFWTFQEYVNATDSWAVRAIQVRARPPATPSAARPARVPNGRRSVSVRITGTSSDGSAFFDPGPDTGGPGFANHIAARIGSAVKVNGIVFLDATHLKLDLDTRGARPGARRLTITNPDGQSASASRILRIVDRSAPQTTLHGPRATSDPTPTFRFHSDEPRSHFQCKLDGGRFHGCRSPKTLPPLDAGLHVFKARAIDRAGNVDRTPARRRFTILP